MPHYDNYYHIKNMQNSEANSYVPPGIPFWSLPEGRVD